MPSGFDFGAVMAVAGATGVPGAAVAQFLPVIESAMVHHLRKVAEDG